MSDVTAILEAAAGGDPQAAAQLLPLVYSELRRLAAAKLAHEKPGQTLQATALVHEAYLRLVGGGARDLGLRPREERSEVGGQRPDDDNPTSNLRLPNSDASASSAQPPSPSPSPPAFQSRGHFFAAAAEAMRRILIDKARQKQRPMHGGQFRRVNLDQVSAAVDQPGDDLLTLDEALIALTEVAPRKAELVKLRFYAGLTIPEAAEALGISHATAERDWTYARTWLYCRLADQPPLDNFSENPSTA